MSGNDSGNDSRRGLIFPLFLIPMVVVAGMCLIAIGAFSFSVTGHSVEAAKEILVQNYPDSSVWWRFENVVFINSIHSLFSAVRKFTAQPSVSGVGSAVKNQQKEGAQNPKGDGNR